MKKQRSHAKAPPAHAQALAQAGRQSVRADTALLAAVFALALIVRLVYLSQARDCPLFDHLIMDARSYWQWSDRIVAGDWVGDSIFYQAPLYPYALAVLKLVFGANLGAIRIVQVVLGSLCCGVLFMAGRLLFGRAAGLVIGVMMALYPPAIFFDTLIQKAGLGLLGTSLLLLAIAVLQVKPRPWVALAGGVVLGLLMLTREETILLAPVLACSLAFRRDFGTRGVRARLCAAFLSGVVLPLLPVAIRNYRVGGEFVLTTAQAGPNFFIGNNPNATGIYMPLRAGRSNTSYERRDAVELAQLAVGRPLSPAEVSRYWIEQAIDFIRHHPGDWLRLVGRKIALLVNSYEVPDAENQYFYELYSPLLRGLSRVWHFGVLLPLGLAGVAMTWARRRDTAVILATLSTLGSAVVAFYVFGRYRFTVVPLLMLFAGAAVIEAARRIRTRNLRSLLVPAVVATLAAVAANWPIYARADHLAESFANAGAAVAESGDDRRAIQLYQEALAREPVLPDTICNLAASQARLGRRDVAVPLLRNALQLRPDDPRIEMRLGTALAEMGAFDDALPHLQRAVELGPSDIDSRSNLMVILSQKGRWAEAMTQCRAIAALRPGDPGAQSGLAWMLSTCPDTNLRDGPAAVNAAERALQLGDRVNPELLDILAAAYAQAQRFEDAVRTAEFAKRRAIEMRMAGLANEIETRLEHYRAGRALPAQ